MLSPWSSSISLGHGINTYIWCAVGGAIGWVAGLMASDGGRIVMIENILVGVFGAFIGGDFLVAMVGAVAPKDTDFHMVSLAMAMGGAVTLLLVLKAMRGAVGPMRGSKSKAGQRRN